MRIVLASASPRRKELINLISDDVLICPAESQEVIPSGIRMEKIPEHLSFVKAFEVSLKYPEEIVIGCDTAVFLGNKILGKPKDEKDAFKMLKSLSGKTHKVISGVTIIKGKRAVSFSEKTKVYFRKLNDAEIEEYIKTKEPMDKAGGYGIQGKGTFFVKKIKGDYFNVVGFPVSKIQKTLKEKYYELNSK
ncbi:MAG: septum formation protein Maf [Oscillospiraceae bacterium]|nr:septum formation protein Maf [Oscillospiraceae bacterium]